MLACRPPNTDAPACCACAACVRNRTGGSAGLGAAAAANAGFCGCGAPKTDEAACCAWAAWLRDGTGGCAGLAAADFACCGAPKTDAVACCAWATWLRVGTGGCAILAAAGLAAAVGAGAFTSGCGGASGEGVLPAGGGCGMRDAKPAGVTAAGSNFTSLGRVPAAPVFLSALSVWLPVSSTMPNACRRGPLVSRLRSRLPRGECGDMRREKLPAAWLLPAAALLADEAAGVPTSKPPCLAAFSAPPKPLKAGLLAAAELLEATAEPKLNGAAGVAEEDAAGVNPKAEGMPEGLPAAADWPKAGMQKADGMPDDGAVGRAVAACPKLKLLPNAPAPGGVEAAGGVAPADAAGCRPKLNAGADAAADSAAAGAEPPPPLASSICFAVAAAAACAALALAFSRSAPQPPEDAGDAAPADAAGCRPKPNAGADAAADPVAAGAEPPPPMASSTCFAVAAAAACAAFALAFSKSAPQPDAAAGGAAAADAAGCRPKLNAGADTAADGAAGRAEEPPPLASSICLAVAAAADCAALASALSRSAPHPASRTCNSRGAPHYDE